MLDGLNIDRFNLISIGFWLLFEPVNNSCDILERLLGNIFYFLNGTDRFNHVIFSQSLPDQFLNLLLPFCFFCIILLLLLKFLFGPAIHFLYSHFVLVIKLYCLNYHAFLFYLDPCSFTCWLLLFLSFILLFFFLILLFLLFSVLVRFK